MKLYRFDGIDENLELLPVAARRALDHAGVHLSLEGFRSLPLDLREWLTRLGSDDVVDVLAVTRITDRADPPPQPMAPVFDPSAEQAPDAVQAAFGPERPIPRPAWSALSALDRYALAKVAQSRNEERREHAYREIVGKSAHSSHVAPAGGVRMVSVGSKPETARRARATSAVSMSALAFERLARADAPKGDVLGTARIAAILATKRTSELIPLCHPLTLTRIDVELSLEAAERRVHIEVTVEARDRTGVEMEALTGASVAALTVYDMLKGFDRSMEIGPTRLEQKSGGVTGDYQR